MSKKKVDSLKKKVEKLYKKGKFYEALALIEDFLKISPDFIEAMNLKAQIFFNLKKYEEFFQTSFNMNLLSLQKDGDIPSEINSPDSWIEAATNLINSGNYDRGLLYITQAAYKSPIVNRDGLSSMTHHENAKIYYQNAYILFKMQDKYDLAKSFFEKANKLDPGLIIPHEIKEIYNDYLLNRSGKGVSLMCPLDMTNLRVIVPYKDKILVSTFGLASAQEFKGNERRSYSWNTHILISNYGLFFNGSKPVCNQAEIHVPWPFIDYKEGTGRFTISPEAYGLRLRLVLRASGDLEVNSRKGPKFQYIDEMNINSLIRLRNSEMIGRIIENLKTLETLPNCRNYLNHYEKVPRDLYKMVKKEAKSRRKKFLY
ncbi:hypothetical protein LCGC14_0498310 [marine sediment metagenome]|uniref:Tetratricopeptide repeat protein n=1 Tax=marine sediment metagenome TaxID=412755 RepID=A0A0F9SN83_9ZZZZ|nr:hypothetical protein [bacterium]